MIKASSLSKAGSFVGLPPSPLKGEEEFWRGTGILEGSKESERGDLLSVYPLAP